MLSMQDIEKSLSQSLTTFKCPAPEGHFPDPNKCDVYYQAGGPPVISSIILH